MNPWTEQELNEVLRMAVRKACVDRQFRQKLLYATRGTIHELAGKPLPETLDVRVTEDSDFSRTLVLPPMPGSDRALSDEDLERVAGGVCINTDDIGGPH